MADDNFVLTIHNATDIELNGRISEIFNEFMRRNSLFVKYPVVFSAGICRLNQCVHESKHGEVDINAAIDRCKIAKSTLKGTHFSSIAFYDGSIRDRALREKDYESIMPGALQRHEFQCYLQPKYGLRSAQHRRRGSSYTLEQPGFRVHFPRRFHSDSREKRLRSRAGFLHSRRSLPLHAPLDRRRKEAGGNLR